MSPPTKKDGDEPEDLAEVERALSVLKGRHPEHERVKREDDKALAERRARLDAAAAVESKRAWGRRLRASAIVVGVLAVAVTGGLLFRSEVARRGAVERAADPFRAMGFVVVETSSRSAPGRLEATPDAGCLVAVSTDEAPLTVTYAAGSFEGASPALFCTCTAEHVAVSSNVAEGGGLALLRVDAAILGGSRAFAFAPFTPGVTARADAACREASLDAWIDAGRAPRADPDDAFFHADTRRAALAGAGFRVVARARASAPFAVVELPAESCLLAAGDLSSDQLSVRVHGGEVPVGPAAGAIAWCAKDAAPVLVAREGTGAFSVAVVEAARVGGLLGLTEIARASGLTLAATAVSPKDRAWNAAQLLLASAVPKSLITTAQAPDVAPAPDARVVALSFATPGALTPESKAGEFSYCEPPLGETTADALCVFSGSQEWRPSGAQASGGLARAKLPFWLLAFAGVRDPVALKAEADLLTFARKLARQGFEPTTLAAMTELPTGAEILGRTGEDAVVALGLAPVSPWVFPYTDGPAWSLGDDPRVVKLAPLATVTLRSVVKPLPSKAHRRTVVFRRHAR